MNKEQIEIVKFTINDNVFFMFGNEPKQGVITGVTLKVGSMPAPCGGKQCLGRKPGINGDTEAIKIDNYIPAERLILYEVLFWHDGQFVHKTLEQQRLFAGAEELKSALFARLK